MTSVTLMHLMAGWSAALLRASWQGGLAIVAVWIGCRLFPRLRPDLRCWLWRLAYAKLLVSLLWVAPIKLPLLPPHFTVLASSGPARDGLFADLEQSTLASPFTDDEITPIQIGLAALSALWLLGLCGYVWKMLEEAGQVRILRLRCRPVSDPGWREECAALARRLGIRRVPALVSHAGPGVPVLIGIRNPSIILPEPLLQELNATQRALIFAHELAHVKRADLLWSWLARVARCAFFFHPLVWLAEHEWQQSQEMACDQLVLQLDQVSPSTYGAVLLHVVQQPSAALSTGLSALRVAESYSTVKRRLIAMKHADTGSRKTLAVTASLTLLVGLIAIVPWQVVAQEASKDKASKDKAARVAVHNAEGYPYLSPKLIQALGITEAQLHRIAEIHEAAMKEIQRALTPKQRKQLEALGAKQAGGFAQIDLTDAQKQKLEGMKREAEAAMRSIKEDASLSDDEKRERIQALRQEHEQAFKQILTPEQLDAVNRIHEKKEDANPLGLSEDQSKQMREIEEHIQTQRRQIEQDGSLTPEQKNERMADLKRSAQEHMHKILTPEQLKRMHEQQTAHQAGPFSPESLAKLSDLTPEQKQRLEAIHQEAHKQLLATLTEAQRAKLQEMHTAK